MGTQSGCGPKEDGLLKCFGLVFEPLGLESTLVHILTFFRGSIVTLKPKSPFYQDANTNTNCQISSLLSLLHSKQQPK